MEESDGAVIADSLETPGAFGAIFDRHGSTLLRFLARRVDPAGAEDLLGEVFRISPLITSAPAWCSSSGLSLGRIKQRKEGLGGKMDRTLASISRRPIKRVSRFPSQPPAPVIKIRFTKESASTISKSYLQSRLRCVLQSP